MQVVAKRVPETILDAENRIQATLESLRDLPLNDELRLGLSFLTRPGYRTVVQLEEDGRKKRSTAAASNWNPDSGEVVIFFEKIEASSSTSRSSSSPSASDAAVPIHDPGTATEERYVKECCEALALAEAAGKAFVALKWFRDEALPTHGYDWTKNTEERQRVLALAIEQGAIRTSRIPNPKHPQFPTTTVSLNHSAGASVVPSRFNPVPINGEPASKTLLRDRGTY